MNFFEKIDNYTENPKMEAIEFSQDAKDTVGLKSEGNETKELSDTIEIPKFEDMIKSGKIQMEWTKVNTSNWCGCNNACFNSCFNVG